MSATISLPPGAALAQLVSNGPNGSALPDAADGLAADAGGAGSFAALFQKLTGRQLATETLPDQVLAVLDADGGLMAEAAGDDDLAALRPFLEAIGLMQTAAPVINPLVSQEGGADIARGDMPAHPLALAVDKMRAAISAATAATAATAGQDGDDAAGPTQLLSTVLDKTIGAASQPASQTKELSAQFAGALQAAMDKPAGQPALMPSHPQGAALPQAQHAAPAALPVAQPVGASGWSQEVGNRIAWMATRQESRAELVLTPPQMGRVEVSLSVTGDQATASFVSANPTVREALEAALPRLREILAEAGIQLGQAQVGAENARQSAQQDKNGDNFGADRDSNRGTAATAEAGGSEGVLPGGLKPGRGLVDTFA